MDFLLTLKSRNEVLFWFGLANLVTAIILITLSFTKPVTFAGTNAWHKPLKFALSTLIFSWSMGWYTGYLGTGQGIVAFNWIIVITLGFEVGYIALQAGKGMASHYNVSSPLYSFLFTLMAFAASLATIATAYIGILFFTGAFPDLPGYYVWAICIGIVLFVIFSFEGFLMGAAGAHTIGGADGSPGLPFLNWSRKFGDARVAHFIGMHALQVLPLLAFFLFKDTKLTIGVGILYAALAVFVLIQALQGRPLFRG